MPLTRMVPEVETLKLGPVRLWRDDLAEIVAHIRDCSSKIEMQADDHALTDVDDLAALAEQKIFQIKQFYCTADGGRIVLRLDANVAELALSNPDYQLRGLAVSIKGTAKRCKRTDVGFLRFAGRLVSIAAVSVVLVVGRWVTGSFELPVPPMAIIYTRTRHEAPPFRTRKRDDLVITAVSNVIALIIGGFVGYYIGKLR